MSNLVKTLMDQAAENTARLDVKISPANGHYNELIQRSTWRCYNNGTVTDAAAEIVRSMNEDQPNGTNHRAQLLDIAELYSKPLANRFSVLRDEVIPFVADIVDICDSKYAQQRIVQAQVVEVSPANLYQNNRMVEVLGDKHFPSISIRSLDYMGGFTPKQEADIASLLETSIRSLDDGIVEMVARHPQGWLEDVYTRYFVQGCQVPTYIQSGISQLTMMDELSVVFFILSNYVNTQYVDPAVNVSLEKYTMYIRAMYENTGALLRNYVMKLTNELKVGSMVLGYDKPNNAIYVIEDVYRDYISQGGHVDALVHAVTHYSQVQTAAMLLKNQDALLTEYQQVYQRKAHALQQAYHGTISQLFLGAFTETYTKQTNAFRAMLCREAYDNVTNDMLQNPNVIGAVARAYANKLQRRDDIGLFDIIIQAILTSKFFAPYGLYDIYKSIDTLTKVGQVSPQQAAFNIALDEVLKNIINSCLLIERR